MDLSVPDASPPLFDFQANIKGVIFCSSWCVKLPLILTHKRSTSTETTLFPRQPHHKKTHFFSCPWGGWGGSTACWSPSQYRLDSTHI